MKKSLALFGAALMAFAAAFSQFAQAGVPPTYPSGFPTVAITGTAHPIVRPRPGLGVSTV
jgi:hypothetical protein